MSSLAERLEVVRREVVDLQSDCDDARDSDPHRPEIHIWAQCEDGNPALIAMSMGALWGQQVRFVDLMVTEARSLAAALIKVADAVEGVTGP